MALLAAVVLSRVGVDMAGVVPTAATGDTWANTGAELVQIVNSSASSINVTLDVIATLDGNAVTDPAVAVAAGATKVIGPFPTAIYNTPAGLAKVTCSAVTTVTIKVLKQVLGN